MHRFNPWKPELPKQELEEEKPARKHKEYAPHFRKRARSMITKPMPETREERQREIHEAVKNAGQRRPGGGSMSLDTGLGNGE